MIKNGIDIFYYYESIWNSGDYIFQFNKTIGYIVKLFVVNSLKKFENFINEDNKQKSYIIFQEFQNILNQLSYDEKNFNLNFYSNFVEDAFQKVINEDLNQNITYQTVRNFRIIGDLIEVFQYFNALDNQLLRLQQFCRWKAKYIEDCLNKGENPIRGGLNEYIYNPENDPKYFIQFNMNSILNLKANNKYLENNNQNIETKSNGNINSEYTNFQNNLIISNNNKYPEYNNQNIETKSFQNNLIISNNNKSLENNNQNIETKSNNNINSEYTNFQNNLTMSNNNKYPEYNNQNTETKSNNNIYPEYNNNIEKLQINNLNNTNNKTKYPNIPQEYNINDTNKTNNTNLNIINNNISVQSQIENKSTDNINNQDYNTINITSSISSSNSKIYTNKPSFIKYTKESIISFDDTILEKYSKNIISSNLIALKELKSKRIDITIQILKNSINILKQFPKKNEQGFYYE